MVVAGKRRRSGEDAGDAGDVERADAPSTRDGGAADEDTGAVASSTATKDDAARLVAQHYSGRANQTHQERKQSPIYRLRCLNNWVKSNLLQSKIRENDRVMDLACGKGGDLKKYARAKIASYLGVDIALESVRRDAVKRYNAEHAREFPAKFVAGDAFVVDLASVLPEYVRTLDVISCQFAIHYSLSTEERARRALRNVCTMLRPGGYFIGTTVDSNVLVRKLREADGLAFWNPVYEVEFDDAFKSKVFPTNQTDGFGIEYTFTLADAVTTCRECMVPKDVWVSLAAEYGLELVEWRNFHDYVHSQLSGVDTRERASALWSQIMGDDSMSMTDEEWEAAYLYTTFVFRKSGSAEAAASAVFNRKPPAAPARIEQDDVLVLEGAA
jgi:mRNA (guanine-N7-)-methyltransferase